MAIDYCEVLWDRAGISKLDILGREIVQERVYDEKKGQYRTVKREVDIREVHENLEFVTECYHGGRNESYFFGASPEDTWRDIDLVGAYSTAMASMGLLEWTKLRLTTTLDDYQHDTVGYAYVKFDFPRSCRFPGLPVRTDNNLIFPRRGETYVTAPEIAVARQQGCQIQIIKGIVIPVNNAVKPIFEVVKTATDGRNAAKDRGDALEDKLYKELINSFYGKFAQGLRKKRVFSTTSGKTEDMEPSRVSQAYIAAHITGLVRAVLSEIMNNIPDTYMILSVTTDGFICNAPVEVTESASDGPVCRIFKRARTALVGNEKILEDKHSVKQVLSWRTRGQATLIPGGAGKLILAKAGLRPPYGMSTEDQNDWIIRNFLERPWNTTYSYDRLRGLRSIYDEGGDLVEIEQTQRMNMDFDFKCRADRSTARVRDIRGVAHLYFKTLPWIDVVDYNTCRDVRDSFTSEKNRCLKSVEDLHVFMDMVDARNNLREGMRHSSEGTLGDALKITLRALVHGQWGMSKGDASYQEWSNIFRDLGYDVTVDMLKKAKSVGPAPDHSIEMIAETARLMWQMKVMFPAFDHNKFYVAIRQKDRDSEVWIDDDYSEEL
ncbi:MAG: DNA polymerase [Verrucomicrobiota bacterium JB024]|nr:DNA polymerase [Verrucomicrobiota bacterium JB024]